MAAYRISIVSLGCPKNLVDSEVIAGHAAREGFEFVVEPADADAVIINTCGFVESAVTESKDTIREICKLKAAGLIDAVLVVGCMVERFKGGLEKDLPGVDAFLPITDYSDLPRILHKALTQSGKIAIKSRGGRKRAHDTDLGRLLLTCPHVAYLRVAEGCNHRCSFCAIPSIRGTLKSKPINVLVEEARGLASLGVKEINLVAEDTTDYGHEKRDEPIFHKLLNKLGKVDGLEWIRILYAYPTRVSDALIDEIARNPKVVPYVDMPIQHISARILKSMRRNTSPERIREVIDALRDRVPGVALRTSVIVGYPGEADAEFEELYAFLEKVRFERLGAFLFSAEEGTAAFDLADPVPAEVAAGRLDRVMKLQQTFVEERNKSLVGTAMEVIVDAVFEKGGAIGRTHADAPEIDCSVNLTSRGQLAEGMIVTAEITGYNSYDLEAFVKN